MSDAKATRASMLSLSMGKAEEWNWSAKKLA
jgi:hypothetical protein